jgi:hypothetical protein
MYATGIVQQLLSPGQIADSLRGGDPIAVKIDGDVPVDFAGSERLDQAALKPMASAGGLEQEIHSGRLTPANVDIVYLELRGVQSTPVDIRSMSVQCIARRPPLAGTLVVGPGPQGGGLSVALTATVDRPAAPITDRPGEPYFETHDITVAKDEAVAVTLRATASDYSCTWDLSLTYDAGSRTGTLEVDRLGIVRTGHPAHPFVLTAHAGHVTDYAAVYDWTEFGMPALVPPSQFCSRFAQRDKAWWCASNTAP